MIGRVIVLALGLLSLSGCAQSFYATQCAKAGLAKGTTGNQACVEKSIADGKREAQGAIAAGLLLGGAVAAVESTVPAQASTATSTASTPQRRLCPDGQYVYGAECRLAPDGSYVGGPVQLAPDGSYVGGNGPVRLCPNGSYVRGNTCRLMPDGSYVGQ